MDTLVEEKVLSECGLILSTRRSHATEYRSENVIVYTVPSEQLNLVINPEDYVFIKSFVCKKYHNSNLKAYPRIENEGETMVHYGYKIVFDDSLSMKQFLIGYLNYKKK